MSLTHLNTRGEAHMVDVADKPESRREATASGHIQMKPETLALLSEGGLPKGDVLATARIAGIQAAKRTHELIPLCHALPLSKVSVDFHLDEQNSRVEVVATCRLNGRTGVEMEALTAVSVACLTLYDMCKAVDKDMEIGAIHLDAKQGGKSGDYRRQVVPATAPIVTGEGVAGQVSVGSRCDIETTKLEGGQSLRARNSSRTSATRSGNSTSVGAGERGLAKSINSETMRLHSCAFERIVSSERCISGSSSMSRSI